MLALSPLPVSRPMLLVPGNVNQMSPAASVVMPVGTLFGLGRGNSVTS